MSTRWLVSTGYFYKTIWELMFNTDLHTSLFWKMCCIPMYWAAENFTLIPCWSRGIPFSMLVLAAVSLETGSDCSVMEGHGPLKQKRLRLTPCSNLIMNGSHVQFPWVTSLLRNSSMQTRPALTQKRYHNVALRLLINLTFLSFLVPLASSPMLAAWWTRPI